MHMQQFQGYLMQMRFIEIHQVFEKEKVLYFSNRGQIYPGTVIYLIGGIGQKHMACKAVDSGLIFSLKINDFVALFQVHRTFERPFPWIDESIDYTDTPCGRQVCKQLLLDEI